MKPRISAIFLGGALMALSIPVACADTILEFSADLSAAQENDPLNNSTGVGTAFVSLNLTSHLITINSTFSGLTSGTTAAHIHCCAPLGTNAPVATMTPSFLGFPLGVTSGTFSGTFDYTLASFYNPAFVTNEGSLAMAIMDFINGLEGGNTYFNIHTSTNPGGEIRGQLSPVPLPAALPLFATGLGVLGVLGWRRKRKQAA